MRCREGRMQYPGMLTFLMIAMPMTIILLNETIGEAIIDATIPALYSALLTLGAFLYSISLAALLVTFCLALAAANYWRFVYHPASVAHSRRKDKLRRLQCEGHNASKFNRLRRSESMRATTSKPSISYLKRLFNMMKHSVQHGVTLLSFRRTQRAKELAIIKKWCGMNRPAVSQGTVRTDEGLPTMMMSPGSVNRSISRSFSRSKSITRFPDNITTMLAASTSSTFVEEKKRRSSLEASMSTSGDENSNPNYSEFIVTTASQANNRRAVTPYLLFTSKGAISHLRSRLSETFGRGVAGSMDVTESSLFDEFRLMLDIFYPDGVALSPAEKEEACDQFTDWKDSVNDHFILNFQGETAGLVEVRVIPFSMFEEWFSRDILSILQNNLPDRLLDNTLKQVPNMKKRLARKEATLLRPDSRAYMRSLTITPQHLVIPLNGESQLI
jgi:hypothetical protein